MKIFFRYTFIVFGTIVVLILLWASIIKLYSLHTVSVQPELFNTNSIEYHYRSHLLLGYLHIIPGIIFLVLGAYQFIPYFRNKYIKLHRFIGKVFLFLAAIIFITAIALALFVPFGNWLETLVTIFFGSYLLYGTYKAYVYAKARKIKLHQKWVTRVYFIAIAVSTIRGIIALFTFFADYTLKEAFGISFLLAFILHFILVEIWIRFLAKKKVEVYIVNQ